LETPCATSRDEWFVKGTHLARRTGPSRGSSQRGSSGLVERGAVSAHGAIRAVIRVIRDQVFSWLGCLRGMRGAPKRRSFAEPALERSEGLKMTAADDTSITYSATAARCAPSRSPRGYAAPRDGRPRDRSGCARLSRSRRL